MRLAIVMAATALLLAACGTRQEGPVLYEVRPDTAAAPVMVDPAV
jgi:hypothetical protein